MKKRIIRVSTASLLSLILVFGTVLSCFAQIPTISPEDLAAQPGNTRAKNPEYSYAWLDSIIVRDDSAKINACELIPVDEYPYTLTVDEFADETEEYIQLFDLNVENVSETLLYLLKTIYYTLISLGMNEPDFDTVYSFLSDYGISYSQQRSDFTELYAQILYSCLKDNSFYVLYGKNAEIPTGVTLEHAVVILLAQALGITLPSGIDTITGLALLVMRQSVPEAELNISDNPSAEEAFYFAKLAVSSENGFDVPTGSYAEATAAQKEYVDYAYFSSILAVKYKVKINPLRLWDAMNSGKDYAVEYLILKTMLNEKGVSYDEDASLSELFELACSNGWFALENEFYSDIYEYNIIVPHECERVWITPFAMCSLLEGGSTDLLTVKINGEPVQIGKTQSVALNTRLQSIKIECAYVDGVNDSTATYTLNVRKAVESAEVTSNGDSGVLGKIEDTIKNALPDDSDEAMQRVHHAFDTVKQAVTSVQEFTVVTTYSEHESTKAVTEQLSEQVTGQTTNTTQTTTDRAAITFTTYPDNELVGGQTANGDEENKSGNSGGIITKAAEIITNNPVAVATPVSLAAIGAALGMIFTKKKKSDGQLDITDESLTDRK